MRWEIDPNHTNVTISAKHMMLTTVRGTLRVKSGWIEFDEKDPEHGRVEVELDAASVNAGVEMRDNDMRSDKFLDVANHPTITFKSTEVEQRDERHARIVGDLTIRGVTRQVALETEFQGRGKSPWNDERIAFTATTTIDRMDDVSSLGRMMIVIGLVVAAVGVLFAIGSPLGRLPGDIALRGDRWSVYIPLGTSILISIVLTLAFALVAALS